MAEQIITKRCYKCKEIKPLPEFHKNRTRKDGHTAECKLCCNKYRKEYHREYLRKYQQTERGKEVQKRYQQSDKGKATNKRKQHKYWNRFPERVKAKKAVNHAIRDGKLPRPDTLKCSCGKQAKQYHHHKGYAPEHWLDVVPVCVKCHKQTHI